jgi:cytosine/adenosine deaminase-related metal-dependent hydrolase
MIVNNADLVTHWPAQPVVSGALLAIEGKTIVDFGPVGKLVSRYDDDSLVLDVAGRMVIPGMIDAGKRIHRSLTSGIVLPWSDSRRLESILDEESLYWSAACSLLDALRSGVTTSLITVSSPSFVEGSLTAVARALAEVKSRGALAYEVSAHSDLDASLREVARHLPDPHGSAAERIQIFYALDAVSASNQEALSKVAEAVVNAPAAVQVRLEEGEAEPTLARRLDRMGIWSESAIARYRGALSPDEELLFRERGVSVSHSAQSDLLSGAGVPDLVRAAAAGVRIVLGTDGCGASLFEEMRVAAYRQRTRGRDLKDAMEVVCRGSFAAAADLATRLFGPEIGRIKPGARADLVVLDYRAPTPLDEETIPEHLFWGASRAPVYAVILNGRVVYQNGELKEVDEERTRARAREAARKMRERL